MMFLSMLWGGPTHAVEVVEDLMHSYNFIVELIVAVGGGQEGVPVCDEHVEQIHNLHEETVSLNKAHRGKEQMPACSQLWVLPTKRARWKMLCLASREVSFDSRNFSRLMRAAHMRTRIHTLGCWGVVRTHLCGTPPHLLNYQWGKTREPKVTNGLWWMQFSFTGKQQCCNIIL